MTLDIPRSGQSARSRTVMLPAAQATASRRFVDRSVIHHPDRQSLPPRKTVNINIDSSGLWKTDVPRTVVILDGEFNTTRPRMPATKQPNASIHQVRRADRLARRKPSMSDTAMAVPKARHPLLAGHDGEEGLRPIRMETRGQPENDEPAILTAFFADMAQLGQRVELVT